MIFLNIAAVPLRKKIGLLNFRATNLRMRINIIVQRACRGFNGTANNKMLMFFS